MRGNMCVKLFNKNVIVFLLSLLNADYTAVTQEAYKCLFVTFVSGSEY